MLPALFIAHGAPTLAMEENDYTRFLANLGKRLTRPRAILLFSAHWLSSTQKVGSAKNHDLLYDFSGFPESLYHISYPAQGDPALAEEISAHLQSQGIPTMLDSTRPLDHGAWVVLRLLYPHGDVPVIPLSVNPRLEPHLQYALGQSLTAYRAKDLLIIGSGGTVHNLASLSWDSPQTDDWAVVFDEWLENRLRQHDLNSLFAYRQVAPSGHEAAPTPEHLMPWFLALGAGSIPSSAHSAANAANLYRSYQHGSLSLSVWQFS